MHNRRNAFCKKAFLGVLSASLVISGVSIPKYAVLAAEKGLVSDYTINNWGSGYQVLIKVKNDTSKREGKWSLKINKNDVGIDSSWNVNVKETGDYYEITPMEWNSVIEPGQAVEFGIQGSSHVGTAIDISVDGQSQSVTPEPTQPTQPEPSQPVNPEEPNPTEPDVPDVPDKPEPSEPSEAVVGDDWLHTDGARIYDKNGHEVYLTGANWFGFNCSERVFHGLWSANMKNVVEGMADHGINLVRVPVSTELLLEWKAGKNVKVNVNTYANPELKRADGSDMS